MPTLQLFDASDARRVIEERRFSDGELVVGRDPGPGGWTINDPDRLISRTHCIFTHAEGRLTVRDLSVNGVALDGRAERLTSGEEVTLEPGRTLRLGRFSILVASDAGGGSPFAPAPGSPSLSTVIRAALSSLSGSGAEAPAPERDTAFDAPFKRPMLAPVEPVQAAVLVPTDWSDADETAARIEAAEPGPDATLLEAFCAGARLDLSAFVAEDPRDVMHALGTVYRQMVLGLGDLMAERVTVKTEFRMTRTTVRAEGNNPFKWAPPQRVAMELLREPADGFLDGPAAVNECFTDLKKHVLCVMAGMRAAVAATVDGLDPERSEAASEGRGLFGVGRNAGLEIWRRQHAAFAAQAADDPDGPVNRAFRAAYEKRLAELDRGSEA